ncbi:MAG: hypothetical protein HY242_01060 [Afipia sp.]|nr:hypothetical protein [Afipia sp.]
MSNEIFLKNCITMWGKQRDRDVLPATTASLVVSILFAKICWILDASSMSLYWVARIPIDKHDFKRQQPQIQISSQAPPNTKSRRTRKIALSVAVLTALAAPFVTKIYKTHPTYGIWTPLNAEEQRELTAYLNKNDWCRTYNSASFAAKYFCESEKQRLLDQGNYQYYFDNAKYFGAIVSVMGGIFVITYFFILLGTAVFRVAVNLFRRYWSWLNA